MSEYPWSKFVWAKHENDDALKLVSLAAQGLWVRMLCAMHRGKPYGHLAINGAPPSPRQLSIMLSVTERDVNKLIPELDAAGIFSRTQEGVIFSRRLVRDKAARDQAVINGKTGGNPTLTGGGNGGGLTPQDNHSLGDTLKTDKEEEREAEKKEPSLRSGRARDPAGCRLPDDWQPEEPGYDGATAGTLAKFRDYWRAQPGAKGRKSDWQATWRNWCRRDAEQPKPKLHTQSPAEQDRRILAAVVINFADPPPLVQPPLRIAR